MEVSTDLKTYPEDSGAHYEADRAARHTAAVGTAPRRRSGELTQ
ncbi:hypothetical protein [Streptomyces coffeae]|nr:hypothetical protein [Streptomyces coffeae]